MGTEQHRMSFAPGTLTALVPVLLGRRDDRAYYSFRGDLSQMGTIEVALRQAGFQLVHSDVYPGFQRHEEETYKRALKYVFDNRIHGWWSQEADLVRYGICSQKEFDKAQGRLLSPCCEERVVLYLGVGACKGCGQVLTRINRITFVHEWLDGNPADTEEPLRPVGS